MEYDVSCPYVKRGLCALDESTGHVLDDVYIDVIQIQCLCNDNGEMMWNCEKRRKYVLLIDKMQPIRTRPGYCIADIPDVTLKIKAREDRIAHLELEKLCIQDKIDIMKHEIEEYKKRSS